MVSDLAPKGFVLKVTLLNTSNPVVHRLLSVPSNKRFSELHETISAAFGWNSNGRYPCSSWVFRTFTRDPILHPDGQFDGKMVIYLVNPTKARSIKPHLHHTTTLIGDKIRTAVAFRESQKWYWWTYNYNASKHRHAVEVLDANNEEVAEISCHGGQGGYRWGHLAVGKYPKRWQGCGDDWWKCLGDGDGEDEFGHQKGRCCIQRTNFG